MYKLRCLTQEIWENKGKNGFAMCYPDYGLDCSPDGECPPDDGSDDCSPYE